ncbi:MAG: putative zinc-binding metallopeptidase [Prevotella sp.]|nr:putative zinc-binding metallopeptidase [Prevotella sp.]
MKNIYILIIAATVALGFTACSDDDPSGKSIFPTESTTKLDEFEQWLLENFTYPYNVEVLYRMKDIESDQSYTLTPADSAKCAKLAKIVKYLWFDAYSEVAGPEFVKYNVPRVLQFIGSLAMNSNNTVVMGTAEGGYKITLYNVNNLDSDEGDYAVPMDDYDALNKWFFTTLHHEFQHILNQKKPYDTSFDLISEGEYVSGDWYQYSTETYALPHGFIRNYAMVEPREDYAELYSQYLTNNDEMWASKMAYAGAKGQAIIEEKLEHIRNYMRDNWNIDLEEMRDAVQHRAREYMTLDYEHLN